MRLRPILKVSSCFARISVFGLLSVDRTCELSKKRACNKATPDSGLEECVPALVDRYTDVVEGNEAVVDDERHM